MRLAAGGAVAMNNRPGIGIDFVSHVSAQTASVEHGASGSNENPAQDIRSPGGIFKTEGSRRLLPLGDIDVIAAGDAGVELARAADLLLRILDHLAPLADPADGAGD